MRSTPAFALQYADAVRGLRGGAHGPHDTDPLVGHDPDLRAHISSMIGSVDDLLLRSPGPDREDPAPLLGQAVFQKSPPPLVPHSPLMQHLLRGLEESSVSLPEAVGVLESEVTRPAGLMVAQQTGGRDSSSAHGRLESLLQRMREQHNPENAAAVTGGRKLPPSRSKHQECADLSAHVGVLAQSLAGLAARALHWSEGLDLALRQELADLVLEYLWPCAHLDDHIKSICMYLSPQAGVPSSVVSIEEVEKMRAALQAKRSHRYAEDVMVKGWFRFDADPSHYQQMAHANRASTDDDKDHRTHDRGRRPGVHDRGGSKNRPAPTTQHPGEKSRRPHFGASPDEQSESPAAPLSLSHPDSCPVHDSPDSRSLSPSSKLVRRVSRIGEWFAGADNRNLQT
eukprot:gnl/TRDRNA2_/TRDRNA2_85040_c0_seq3.p1 gnl/TRDRNA2_/TRDRNA2_85040_c0~~gnl/TRDRNA2_/TRDRNA2_85040_c0_seq3.p1  ORF type:complete len:398 (+),score=43.30 gnl/TRDRNA2_/TRDRNA2_85040_c0_seq3:70-1263(+)